MSTISVAIVNYNTRDVLRPCLVSLLAEGVADIVVADNGSTDGSLEMLRDEFPSVAVLVDRSNPGYGGAANAAIAHSSSDYVLLLNSDTVMHAGAVDALRQYLDAHPRAGVVGPRLRNPDGTLQRSLHQFPTPLVTLLDYSWVGPLVGKIPLLRKLYLASDSHERARAIPWVTGAALAFRRSAFEAVGGFDTDFFMYYEEVDLSYRMLRAGWETHFDPHAEVTHVGGASTSQIRGRMYVQQIRAALQYSQRHHMQADVELTHVALKFGLLCRLVGDRVRLLFARDDARRAWLKENIAILQMTVSHPLRAMAR